MAKTDLSHFPPAVRRLLAAGGIKRVTNYAGGLRDRLRPDRCRFKVAEPRPAEPEAWEWAAAVKLQTTSHPAYYPAPAVLPGERLGSSRDNANALAREHRRIGREAWVARRRPGTAPGPWERVDPEPRTRCIACGASAGDLCRAPTMNPGPATCPREAPETRPQDGGEQ